MTNERPNPPTVRPAVPSDRAWFDPRLIAAVTFPQLTTVVVPMGQVVAVAPANSRRWGIMFCTNALVAGLEYAPWPDLDDFAFGSMLVGEPNAIYTLENYGPLIQSSWWARLNAGGNVRVVELLRL